MHFIYFIFIIKCFLLGHICTVLSMPWWAMNDIIIIMCCDMTCIIMCGVAARARAQILNFLLNDVIYFSPFNAHFAVLAAEKP